jgi:hypothetical protein
MRRIRKATIKAVSLVSRGANLMPVLYKADEGIAEFSTLSKVGSEGLITTVVYPRDYRDGQGDTADEAVVKEMAYSHAREGFTLDVHHDGKVLKHDQAFVAESFIIQKGDERFKNWTDTKGQPVDVTGSWAQIIKVEDTELRKKLESGEIAGVSIFGPAVVTFEKGDELEREFMRRMRGESSVDETKLATMLKAQTDAIGGLFEKLVKELKPAPAAPPSDETIKFEGDPANLADLQKHAAKLARAELVKSGALSDPAKLAELIKAQAPADDKNKGSTTEQLEKALADQKAETAKLEKRLADARKGSNADPAAGDKGDTRTELQKELDAGKANGSRLAAIAAKNRGYALPKRETVAK